MSASIGASIAVRAIERGQVTAQSLYQLARFPCNLKSVTFPADVACLSNCCPDLQTRHIYVVCPQECGILLWLYHMT